MRQYLKCWNVESGIVAKMLGKHMPDEVTIDNFINEENNVVSGVVEVDWSTKGIRWKYFVQWAMLWSEWTSIKIMCAIVIFVKSNSLYSNSAFGKNANSDSANFFLFWDLFNFKLPYFLSFQIIEL